MRRTTVDVGGVHLAGRRLPTDLLCMALGYLPVPLLVGLLSVARGFRTAVSAALRRMEAAEPHRAEEVALLLGHCRRLKSIRVPSFRCHPGVLGTPELHRLIRQNAATLTALDVLPDWWSNPPPPADQGDRVADFHSAVTSCANLVSLRLPFAPAVFSSDDDILRLETGCPGLELCERDDAFMGVRLVLSALPLRKLLVSTLPAAADLDRCFLRRRTFLESLKIEHLPWEDRQRVWPLLADMPALWEVVIGFWRTAEERRAAPAPPTPAAAPMRRFPSLRRLCLDLDSPHPTMQSLDAALGPFLAPLLEEFRLRATRWTLHLSEVGRRFPALTRLDLPGLLGQLTEAPALLSLRITDTAVASLLASLPAPAAPHSSLHTLCLRNVAVHPGTPLAGIPHRILSGLPNLEHLALTVRACPLEPRVRWPPGGTSRALVHPRLHTLGYKAEGCAPGLLRGLFGVERPRQRSPPATDIFLPGLRSLHLWELPDAFDLGRLLRRLEAPLEMLRLIRCENVTYTDPEPLTQRQPADTLEVQTCPRLHAAACRDTCVCVRARDE